MTSMSMLCILSLCTCRTARWLSRCWLIELHKYVFRRLSDEKLRSASALLHGIVSMSQTSFSTWSNIQRTTGWADVSFVAMSSTDSICQFCCRIIASCMARLLMSISRYADMMIFNSSLLVPAAIETFSSCMYWCSPGWSYMSFSWLTAVSTTWKKWLQKYSSTVIQVCAGAGPQNCFGGWLWRGNSGNGMSLSWHSITSSSNRAWNLSSSQRSFNALTVVFIAVTMEATDLLLDSVDCQHGWGFKDAPTLQQHISGWRGSCHVQWPKRSPGPLQLSLLMLKEHTLAVHPKCSRNCSINQSKVICNARNVVHKLESEARAVASGRVLMVIEKVGLEVSFESI